ncbi:ABC transporter substrate-binding protein, partial [Bacillus pumilus]|uniref:ABC transporter substrate-binding protein n=1 Tax=Bacillus pumilus TaxID=1408 RepID=UPI003C14418F
EGTVRLDADKQVEASGKYETKRSEPVATRQLVMNTKVDQLADEKVRHALQYAINKKSMGEGGTSGLEDEADHILPTNMP